MKEGGRRLALVMKQVLEKIKPGIALYQLDKLAEDLIIKQNGKPSFKMVSGYRWTTCINVNEGVVHGIPGDYRLKENDLVSVDIGMFYQGFHTDMARTVKVGDTGKKEKFLVTGEKTLRKAIEVAKVGNRVGHISQTIESELRKAGFSPSEDLTGHGVGKNLHENPQIPCFLKEKINKTPLLEAGMTLAVEVIYAQGKPEVILSEDGWTIKTADKSLSALFEDTIAVLRNQTLNLTSFNKMPLD